MNTKHHYLRLLRTFALAALTAAAAAACSDDTDNDREPLTPPDGADGIPVTFTADINPGSDADPAAAPGTRTVLTPTANGGFTVEWKGRNDHAEDDYDFVRIWAAKENTLIGGVGKRYVPTTSGASSALEPMDAGEKLTLTEPGEWKFTAVYGTYGVWDNMAYAFIAPQSQSVPDDTKHIAEADFSIATATQNIAAENDEMSHNINLKFKHMLSALQLQVKNGTSEALTVNEIRFSVKDDQIACRRKYDIAMENWKADGEQKEDYLELKITTPAALAPNATPQNFYTLLFPGYADTDMTITVITDRGEYALTKTAPAGGFAAAKNYMTDITIKTDGLTADEKWVEYISNKAELAAFRDKVNNGDKYTGKTVRLTADIDLTDETWTPIGNFSNSFSGTFDGGGHHISRLNVDNGSANYAGLFGYVSGGTVRNLRVSGTVTTTGLNAGGIAGTLDGNSTVENCIFDGDVSSGNGNVGGIAGYSYADSRIAGCHTKGKVTATATTSYDVGGIAGKNSGTIDGCYSEAEVKASGRAGGIAGSNENGTITHCYATGKVSGKKFVGGIVGYQYNSSVTGCIALNPGLTRTEGSSTSFGRIVSSNQGGSTVTSCGAYDGMTITDNASQPITGTGEAGDALPAADCLTTATYTTTHGFTAADAAATTGWAFDTATPWQYLPWNKVFESFPGISETDYRIAVPAHLNASVIP